MDVVVVPGDHSKDYKHGQETATDFDVDRELSLISGSSQKFIDS